MITRIRCYSELSELSSFEDRFDYLMLDGAVGRDTFGFDRYINQRFYQSREWKSARDTVIIRDNGCDLGISGYELEYGLLIHHMNPMTADHIKHGAEWILDPEYLITTCHRTHNAIHYGNVELFPPVVIDRSPGDTIPWRRQEVIDERQYPHQHKEDLRSGR